MQRIAFYLSLTLALNAVADANWNQFRGPAGNGHVKSANLPLKWSETSNIRWKTAIHGRAWSSPVIWDNQVWMTTASADGKQLGIVVVDKDSGKIIHDKKLFDVAEPQFAHKFNSYASPTPAIEEGRVYVTWGSPATACLDTKTFKIIWERRDLVCDHFRGAGSSPIIFRNLLINNYDGADTQYVHAFDKKTGKSVWNTKRSVDFKDLDKDGKPAAGGDWRKAYSTPHIAWAGKSPILLSSGAKAHYAYNPVNGKEIWRMDHHGQHSASTRPLFGHGNAYFPTGFGKGELIVVPVNKKGALSEDEKAWHVKRSVPKKPSMLLVKNHLYTIDDGGIASCYNAKTGEVLWQDRLARRSGNFSASPILSNGKIYISNEDGETFVIETNPKELKVVATNKLEDGCMASPAISDNAIFLRTKTHLYRIEK